VLQGLHLCMYETYMSHVRQSHPGSGRSRGTEALSNTFHNLQPGSWSVCLGTKAMASSPKLHALVTMVHLPTFVYMHGTGSGAGHGPVLLYLHIQAFGARLCRHMRNAATIPASHAQVLPFRTVMGR
jgi:hypothetical protein